MTLAHLAAINILKRDGIENAKREPLSTLNQKGRQRLRAIAKRFAAMIDNYTELTVSIPRIPIKHCEEYGNYLLMRVQFSRHSFGQHILPERLLNEWDALSKDHQRIAAYRFAQSHKLPERRIAENIDVIKANLELLLPSDTQQ